MQNRTHRAALVAFCGSVATGLVPWSSGVSYADNVTISGNIKYTGRAGAAGDAGSDGTFNSRGARVEIYDKNSSVADVKLGEVFTDDAGNYSFVVSSNETDAAEAATNGFFDVYVTVSPLIDSTKKSFIGVTLPGGGTPETAGLAYTFSTAPLVNQGTNAAVSKTFGATGNVDRSFAVFDASITRYHSSLPGTVNNSVFSTFPTANGTSNFSGGRMHILQGDRYDWDVIGHEYGHYVQSLYGIADSPGGDHSSARNLRYQRTDLTRDQANKLAWGEGWATFFSISGQQEMNVGALGIQRAGDVIYNDNDDSDGTTAGLTYSLESQTGRVSLGEDNELAVARILYDLYDSTNDVADRDRVSIDDGELFKLVDENNVTSLNSFWSALRDSTTENETRVDYGAIFQAHNVSPRPDETSVNGDEFLATDAPPEFEWEIPKGTLTAGGALDQALLNGFTLKFFDALYNEIVLAGLGDLGNVTSFTPSAAQWAQLTNQLGTVNWIVLGKDDRGGVETGYYWSDSLNFSVVPEPIGIAPIALISGLVTRRRRVER